MARVYISSTHDDLILERQQAMDWLIRMEHQPVHSYRPDGKSIRDSCLEDIDSCDLYVLILCHRYGFQPEEANPEKLSITHLEFRRAKQSRKPRIALLRTSIPDIRLSDVADPVRMELVRGFQTEVRREVTPGEFKDSTSFINMLSAGIQGALDEIKREKGSADSKIGPDNPRVLEIVATLTEELNRKNRQIEAGQAENASLRGRISELEEELRKSAIARTLTAAAQPGASSLAVAAAAALGTGDTKPTEAFLNSQETAEAARIGEPFADDAIQRGRAAALAREQGALLIGHDVRAALEAFERAAEYDAEDVWDHFFIGDLRLSLGDTTAAGQAYRRGHDIAEARTRRDPGNMVWQRDLTVSQNKVGDVLVSQGDGPGALVAYRRGLEIAEALASRDPANTQWQRDLSVSHDRIADVLMSQGDVPGALVAYRRGLEIREALASCDPANTEWQRDLSVSHDRIADVLMSQGDVPGALSTYRRGLEIAEALASRDPANTQWQRDLTVSQNKVGDVLVSQGDGPGALAAYRKGLEIREALVSSDPANALWQVDLAVSFSRLGMLKKELDRATRRHYLERGKGILSGLKEMGRLMPNQDWISWFDDRLEKLAKE